MEILSTSIYVFFNEILLVRYRLLLEASKTMSRFAVFISNEARSRLFTDVKEQQNGHVDLHIVTKNKQFHSGPEKIQNNFTTGKTLR